MLGKTGSYDTAFERKVALIHLHPDDCHLNDDLPIIKSLYGANAFGTYVGSDKYNVKP